MPRSRKPHPANDKVVERGLERFRAMLRERALNSSKVREAIARAALAYDGHFSVEDLSRALREQGVNEAHTTTVYRALPLLIDAGLVQRALVSHPDGMRYEAAFEREHHDHLMCTRCGRVVEFHSSALEALQNEIAERHGFLVEDHIHELRGACRDCRKSFKPVASR